MNRGPREIGQLREEYSNERIELETETKKGANQW
jgi:hypothetical protein